MTIDRRELLGGAVGAVTAMAMGGEVSSPPRATSNVDSRTLYRKLHYRLDDGVVFWWLQGPKYGQVGTVLTPLYQANIGTFQRIRHLDDGGFELTALEINIISNAMDIGIVSSTVRRNISLDIRINISNPTTLL